MQLTLGIKINEDCTYDNFYVGHNQELVAHLKKFAGSEKSFIYLWGRETTGRSHLLQAACHEADNKNLTSVYLPLAEIPLSPKLFVDLEEIDLVCLDDIEFALQEPACEEALFHLYNRLQEKNRRLLISALAPPAQLTCRLPDLKSRLSWGLIYELHGLDDDQLLAALQLRAARAGLQLSNETGNYLVRHYPRNMKLLIPILEKLDQESLVQQRHITIPFIKEVMKNST